MAGWWCLLLVAAVSVAYTEGSTLDLYEAILRVPFLNRSGQDEWDFFGYSVALHDTVEPSPGRTFLDRLSGARIVVGVPGGTPVGAVVNASGYVAECPLLPGSCDALRGSGMGGDPLYDIAGNRNNTYVANKMTNQNQTLEEDKSGMFLGGAMASLGDKFIVCGHRYVSDTNSGAIQGLCYESRRDLSNFSSVPPCLDPVASGRSRSTQEFFFLNAELTYCMGGMDVVYTNDSSSLVLGAPGTRRNFQGGFAYRDGDQLKSAYFDGTMSSETYAGYSVAQGVIKNGSKHVVVGAPRSRRGMGLVFIVERFEERGPFTSYTVGGMDKAEILDNPEQIGNYFGHCVALVDFNGDGLAEVVVASPLHFLRADQPELGAVHVFSNMNGTVNNSMHTPLIGSIPYGRFGHAMAAMGDLNYDGYEDLVVSAPFGADGSAEPGTVYVFLGSASGVRREPAQVIRGSQLNLLDSQLASLRSFGASLSGDTDIDGNTYNDLVIGAYESRQVFVLRSRTVVVIDTFIISSTTMISITSDSEKMCLLGGVRYNCFYVQFCLSVRGKGLVSGQALNISYSFRSDQNAGGTPRTIVNERMESELNATVALRIGQGRFCDNVTVHIKSVDSIYQTPLRPTIVAYIPDETRPPRSDGNISPTNLQESRLFSRQEPADSFVEVQGAQTCDGVCETDVNANSSRLELLDDEGRSQDKLFLGIVTRASLSMNLTVADGVEDAYGVCVNVSAPAGFRYSSQAGFDSCNPSPTTVCCLNAPITSGQAVPVRVHFSIVAASVADTSSVTLRGLVMVGQNTIDTVPDNNAFNFSLSVVPSADASISIDVTSSQLVVSGNYTRSPQDALPVNARQLGRQFNVSFSLTNLGPSDISLGRFVVRVPYRTPCTTNAFLYYISSIEWSGILRGRCTMPEVVDVLRFQDEISNQTSLLNVPGECALNTTTIDISCAANPTWCVEVECSVTDFKSSTEGKIAVAGYLDEHYVFYRTRNHFALGFEGDFVIDETSDVADPFPNQVLTRVVLTNPNVVSAPEPIPWWAIAVPIVVAIIFVIALIVALYLCGFFKRKRTWTPEEDHLTEQPDGQGEGQPDGQGEGQVDGEGEEPVVAGAADTRDNKEVEHV